MECNCLRYREVPHTAKLFTTYIEDFGRLQRWYRHAPGESGVLDAAREVKFDSSRRNEVAAILGDQNRQFGPDSAVQRNLDRLANGALAIVTGQQVGLFTGPAYTFYKALTAIRWADHLTSLGFDAVPVFWLATEDHDIAEVNHTFWNVRSGLTDFALPVSEESSGGPVGSIQLPKAITELVEKADASLEGSYAVEVSEFLKSSYREGETFGSAFAKFFAKIFARKGLILLDPADVRFHRITAGVYRDVVEKYDLLHFELLKRGKELEAAGFHAQVRVISESTLLFVNMDGKRQSVRNRNGNFIVGKKSFTANEFLRLIDQSPEIVSPNALFRPVIQDSLLPTAGYVAGPAEIAYYAQAEVVYRNVLGRMPVILPRASYTLVDPPIARILKKYQIDVRDVMRGRQYIRGRLAFQALPKSLAHRFERDQKTLQKILTSYRAPLEKLDRTLLGSLETAERKMLYQFQKLRAKGGRAENLRTGVLDRHEELLVNALYPQRGLQERTANFLPLLASYGPELLDDLTQRSAPRICGHQICLL